MTFGTNATAYSAPKGQGMPTAEAQAEQVRTLLPAPLSRLVTPMSSSDRCLSQVTAEPAAGTSMTSTLKPDGSTDVYGACVVMGPGDVRPHSCHVLASWVPSSDSAQARLSRFDISGRPCQKLL